MASSQAVCVENISEPSRPENTHTHTHRYNRAHCRWGSCEDLRPTLALLMPPEGQQLRDVVLDEVQQLDGVGHPHEQRLQTREQLVHSEHLKETGLQPRSPEREQRNENTSKVLVTFVLTGSHFWLDRCQFFGPLLKEGEHRLLHWDQPDTEEGPFLPM